MAVLSAAAAAVPLWKAMGRDPSGCGLGALASAGELLLLQPGNRSDQRGGTADHLYHAGDFFCLRLYENGKYLGTGGSAFPE